VLPWSTTHRHGAAGPEIPFGPASTLQISIDKQRARSPLLCVRCNRPKPAAFLSPSNELPPSHSITSSARASRFSGTVRPSALAVFRLMTSSNLVGCCTGKSAGLAPRRIGATY
jgi:hypothetical protein